MSEIPKLPPINIQRDVAKAGPGNPKGAGEAVSSLPENVSKK